jgi:ABC-type Fe3+-hydroxamate transport system substrate-binding protein
LKVTDQIGRELTLNDSPLRIVSTVPSITEFLFDLGLEEEIVGVTKFCIYPKSKTKKKAKIGGTKDLKIEEIKKLNPDLIICNKEENDKKQIESLSKEFPTYVTQIKDFNSAISALEQIGIITAKKEEADSLIDIIKTKKQEFDRPVDVKKACYLIWRKPYMTIGDDTYIHSMMQIAGFENVFKGRQRYPKVSLAQIKSLKPDVIMLSSEPFPFAEKHMEEISKEIKCDIVLVNGEFFSWYGSKMLFAFKYFEDLNEELSS